MTTESDLDRRGEAMIAELHKLRPHIKKKAPKWLHDLLDWAWDHLFG
jgi:hypothetical protein